MGILKFGGAAMDWNESIPHIEYIKEHGITQFLEVYKNSVHRDNDELLWGDEIEYMLVEKNPQKQKVYLKLRAKEIIGDLNLYEEAEKIQNGLEDQIEVSWKPEYGNFMLEATPYRPFPDNLSKCVQLVESNIQTRDRVIKKYLQNENEILLTMTIFPQFGARNNFTIPKASQKQGKFSKSLFVSDDIMNPHPRFKTLTQNARLRRGSSISTFIPLMMDKNTCPQAGIFPPFTKTCVPGGIPLSSSDPNTPSSSSSYLTKSTEQPQIFLDSFAFGMSCCCLQQTFQAKNITESRFIYDQFVVLAPIFLSLTSASPIVKGLLANTDARWNIICGCCDDRTEEERKFIPKSRYASVSLYISNTDEAKRFSDLPNLPINEKVFEFLKKEGLDEQLSKHIGHLWIRDPLAIYSDYDQINDKEETDHWENIQSTNWQSVRWKPPPSQKSKIGWRVEFRIMEIQFSAFENAAFLIFLYLIVKCIQFFNLNFYMPISKVDVNVERAHAKNSVLFQKFWFRNSIFDFSPSQEGYDSDVPALCSEKQVPEKCAISEFTINDIINGGNGFIGLIPTISKYLDICQEENSDVLAKQIEKITSKDRERIDKYLELISKRASGAFQTPATFIRNFVASHPDYKQDSVISSKICYDLVEIFENIHNGSLRPEALFGK